MYILGTHYYQQLEEKQSLLTEFRYKFRNISSIMNCVTCEKCKLWGKLQILGIGTAIKLLLYSEEELHSKLIFNGNKNKNHDLVINRQELIALINTLNQLAKSIEFAQNAKNYEINYKLSNFKIIFDLLDLIESLWHQVLNLNLSLSSFW